MLCQWLYHLTSIDLFDGRLFRAGTAAMLSIILVMCLMPVYIRKLQSLGFRIWYDSGVPAGSEWDEEIAAHLKRSRCFLSLLTPHSVESKHFKREFSYADYLQ